MNIDTYGQIVLSEQDICDLYLQDPERKFKTVLIDKLPLPSNDLSIKEKPRLQEYKKLNLTLEQYDLLNQNTWFMPDEYKTIDIAKYVLDLCSSDAELQRAGEELILYQEKNLFMLLKYLKYLVDTMREHNIVWGVGRGSSVASFVLFLLGVHRINSLYYDLSIDEFLK